MYNISTMQNNQIGRISDLMGLFIHLLFELAYLFREMIILAKMYYYGIKFRGWLDPRNPDNFVNFRGSMSNFSRISQIGSLRIFQNG